ncbi:hypothetical protein O1611_g3370 [Lasiodiplodia mahajangana]|uniref:Uncharacterized protein n=1 Tax=Lasiodiplodia mahajangana TaxID=1108764 RepID=A0ACC2JS56_9PEZI|nr:hypothetical protein O1611_g3370 [Lasiodiplodia mahajangana]
MPPETHHQSSGIGQSSDHAIPQTQPERDSPSCTLHLLDGVENPVANLILIRDVSKPASSTTWQLGEGKDLWPTKIPRVDIYEFVYTPIISGETGAKTVDALKIDLSTRLQELSNELGEAVMNPHNWRAKRMILVGYGYGGLLCEQVINNNVKDFSMTNIMGLVLFGTPHFAPGLKQWVRIVLETIAQSESGVANKGVSIAAAGANIKKFFRRSVLSEDLEALKGPFKQISDVQESFFEKTTDSSWGSQIVSCFAVPPISNSENKLTILPEWSTVPYAVPVMIRKPYLGMTAFADETENGYQAISQLIRKWIEQAGTQGPGPDQEPKETGIEEEGDSEANIKKAGNEETGARE